jgi:hypothetical protein
MLFLNHVKNFDSSKTHLKESRFAFSGINLNPVVYRLPYGLNALDITQIKGNINNKVIVIAIRVIKTVSIVLLICLFLLLFSKLGKL